MAKSQGAGQPRRRQFLAGVSFLLAFPITGCASMDSDSVDHAVQILNLGKTGITDVTYSYGDLGLRHVRRLGLGGDGVTQPMSIPEFVEITWTTESDGKQHAAKAPIRSVVTPQSIAGKTVSIEIDGAVLKVLLIKNLPNFKEEKTQIYSNQE